MSNLTGAQIEALTGLLADTLNGFNLETIVHVATGDRLYAAYTSNLLPLKQQIRQTLEALEQDGTTALFLGEVHRRRPNRPDVQDAITTVFPGASSLDPEAGPALSLQHGGVADGSATAFALAPGLQKNVKPHLRQLDLGTWPDELIERRGRICRVEVAGRASGTGFLVGPSAVLTNWHVVKDCLDAASAGRIACRFDFLAGTGSQPSEGTLVKLGPGGVLDSSPCSNAELSSADPDVPPPGPHELDYALLELAEPMGTGRGFERLPEFPPALQEGAALLIFQHPNGERMKLALDTEAIIGRRHGDLRLRYRTNTEPGSSGSPCFTMDWTLVALHHYGDPAHGSPRFNQGIPIELVRKRIVEQGRGATVGLD
jgi:hypothetical protein